MPIFGPALKRGEAKQSVKGMSMMVMVMTTMTLLVIIVSMLVRMTTVILLLALLSAIFMSPLIPKYAHAHLDLSHLVAVGSLLLLLLQA